MGLTAAHQENRISSLMSKIEEEDPQKMFCYRLGTTRVMIAKLLEFWEMILNSRTKALTIRWKTEMTKATALRATKMKNIFTG